MLKEICKKEGTSIDTGGNAPVLLKDEDSVWFVESGNVDLFAVRVKDDKPVGSRAHVFRAGEGQILFGVDPGKCGVDIGFLAVGTTDTRLCRLRLSRIQEFAREDLVGQEIILLVDRWITGLSASVQTGLTPKVFVELEAGREISVDKGDYARPLKGILWVRQKEGGSCFMGRKEWPLVEPNRFFPVSENAWLMAEVESKMEAFNTDVYMAQPAFWPDLRYFNCLILDCLSENIKEELNAEKERLKKKAENEKAVFEDALSKIANIFEPETRVITGGAEDALLLACKQIGEMIGIEFKAPSDKSASGRDRLDAITRASRVRKRKVLLRGEWWHCDNGPLLAVTNQDKRPVALLSCSPKRYEIYDPLKKERKPVDMNVANSLASFAYTFYRPFPERALKGLDLLKHGLFGYRKDLFMVVLMGIAGALLGLLTPIATGIVFDTIIPEAAHSHLIQVALILLTTAIAISVFEITRGIALLRSEAKADSSIQAGVIDRLLTLPVPFFRRFTAGDLAQRALGINRIREILSGVTVQAILAGIFSSFNFILMFWYDWKLALMTTGILFISILFIGIVNYIQVRYQRSLFSIQGKISGMVLQFITGVSKLRISGTEDRAFAVWTEAFRQQKRIAYKSQIVANILATYNAAFPILAIMAIFAWVASKSMGTLSTGGFLAFNSAYNNFQNALLQMVVAFTSVLNIIPLYERAKPVIETVPEVDISKVSPGELTGDVDVSHIRFRYIPDGPLILNDVSLEIAPGEFVALVGGSGSGKSTLFRILLGFETPESGTIYYDAQDLATLDIGEVRRQVGVVLQNGKIMPGSIYDNIVGASNLSMDDAWEAGRMSGLDEDIKAMPMEMHTVLSAGGGTLSGGQRQRLLIARAIIHKPRILFFDEATSALDNKTQEIVSRSLEKLQATRVVIAHRLSTIINADRIFVIDKGRLVQSGTYNDLFNQEGLFAELAKRQIA